MPVNYDPEKILQSIWRRRAIDPITGCWIWLSSRTRGYPYIAFKHRGKQRNVRLTRFIAWLYLGYDGDPAHEVCHRCNVKSCFNPGHLYIATHLQNVRDAARDGLLRPSRGVKNGSAKLDVNQVLEIWATAGCGRTVSSVARQFGVSRRTVSRIWEQLHWKEVTGAVQ